MTVKMVQVARRLFTVDDFYRMAEAGILREDDRVELIEGEIVEMVPTGSHHGGAVKRLIALIRRTIEESRTVLSVQDSLRVNERTELLPDLCLLRPRGDFYGDSNPQPHEVLLLIEVSDSTIARDRRVKLPIYARAGIPEVWLVDVKRSSVAVYREPGDEEYAEHIIVRRGGSISPMAFPDVSFAVDEIFG